MDISQSLNQILQEKDRLGKIFYDHFFERSPEVKRYFEGVDMKRQAVILTTALMVVVRHHDHPTPAIEQFFAYMGTKHHDLSIGKELYPKWTKAMLESLQAFHGDQWDDQLEDQWREAIARAIELMFTGYEQHITI